MPEPAGGPLAANRLVTVAIPLAGRVVILLGAVRVLGAAVTPFLSTVLGAAIRDATREIGCRVEVADIRVGVAGSIYRKVVQTVGGEREAYEQEDRKDPGEDLEALVHKACEGHRPSRQLCHELHPDLLVKCHFTRAERQASGDAAKRHPGKGPVLC